MVRGTCSWPNRRLLLSSSRISGLKKSFKTCEERMKGFPVFLQLSTIIWRAWGQQRTSNCKYEAWKSHPYAHCGGGGFVATKARQSSPSASTMLPPPKSDSVEEAALWWNKTVPLATSRSPPTPGRATLLFIHVPKSTITHDPSSPSNYML